MSSIIKVKNGKGEHWKAIYDLPKFADGTRRRTSKTFPVGTPLKIVKEFVAQKELEAARGLSLENNPKITFEELGNIYFSSYTQFLSPTSRKGYEAIYFNCKEHGILKYWKNCQVRNIKTRDIQDYINFLSTKVSAKSVRNYVIILNLLFDLAVQERLIQRESNPMLGKLVLPKYNKKPVEAYSLEEFNLLLKLAEQDENPNIELIINLTGLSAMRRGEVCGLKWSNINFKEGYLNVVENRVRVDKITTVKQPKTKAGIRKIYVPQRLLDILKKYHTQYMLNKMKYGKDFIDSDYVIVKENGEPYTPQGITNCYVRFLRRHSYQIRYLKFHGLRHTMASILCDSVPITTISKILGHTRTSTTADIYLHESVDSQIEAAAKLDETIENIRKTG